MWSNCIIKQPLAMVGIACRFPGADDLDQYWNLVQSGACSIAELSSERLDRALYFSPVKGKGSEGKTYSTLSGMVSTPQFDPSLCAEPDTYDIAHLIMLEVAANACRDAGWDPLALPLRNVGVYIGHARTSSLSAEIIFSAHVQDYLGCLSRTAAFERLPDSARRSLIAGVIHRVHRDWPHLRESGKPFLDPAMAATLVSQSLGLTGPHMVIDAACASSLVAVALAAGPLQEGRIDMAIAGGASFSNWQSMALFSKAQALSATGSYPFDSRADGFVSSDGYAAVVLKTLSRALADGDRIHAVIRGIGLSSDGHGKSLWAPRKEGQIEAIRRAYSDGVDPSGIQYIEAHGTSTQVGDATELQSLAEVFGPVLPRGRKIPIASVKGNIGHTCETAGLAGLIKTVLAMRHGTIPPAANFQRPSPEINLDRLPFLIPARSLEWPAASNGAPRRAAVDAFGIGGLNVHLVVDEFVPSSKPSVSMAEDPGVGDKQDIAIIGVGAIFPGARTAAAFWEMLASGSDPRTIVPEERGDPGEYWNPQEKSLWRSHPRSGGFIADFKLDLKRFRIPPKQMETADPLQYMVLDAADQALRDAGYDGKSFDRRRVAVIVGTMFCSEFMRNLSVALQYPEFERELQNLMREQELPEESVRDVLVGARKNFFQRRTMLKDETGSFSASTLASRVARMLDFMGGAFSVDAEEASSGAALDAAVALLRSGACDMVLCAGAQRSMDISLYEEYALRGLVSADDREFIPAEGTGVLLLKRAADAKRDGDGIRAVIKDVRGRRGEAVNLQSAVASQMGHALGAAGMASVLAALAPDAAESATIQDSTLRGLSFEIDIEKRIPNGQRRIAFLFPGQGSQYTGMLRELVRESSAAAAKLHEADAVMKTLGYQTFSEIAWEPGSGLGTDPWQTQISMLLSDLIVLAALEALGVRPNVVAGHSYGEFPALVAAGALTLEQAIRATRARVDLVQSSAGASCRLMATNADAESARKIVDASGLSVHVAILNAPDQTILGGSGGDLEGITPSFKAAGFYCTSLPLPGSFHTPLFADMRDPFLRALASIQIVPPHTPLLSSVSIRYVAEPAEIRENLAAQPSTPLDYSGMVRRLSADGVTVFIEVGPQQVLTRLNQRLLGGSAVAVACDPVQKPGPGCLMEVKRTLEACGVDFSAQGIQIPRPDLQKTQKHEILYFDATLRRREKNLRQPDAPVSVTEEESQTPESLSAGGVDWNSYLIQFVCEQTGYAREVVDLDADLESDLGIDSIKKMQLFGELREQFDFSGLQPSALANFSTLRHVLDFLQQSTKVKESRTVILPSSKPEDGRALKILRLQGSPYSMGREHGRRQAGEIQAVVRRYSEVLGGNVSQRRDLNAVMENLDAYFSKTGLEELHGLADGAGLPLQLIAGFNLALIPELLSGCSHFAFGLHAQGSHEILHGANEDAPLVLMLGRALMPAALVRHPEGGIPHLTFVLPGQFAGINGLNARGLAVSSTLLLDRLPAGGMPSGRVHCDLVKEILESAEDIETAVNLIRGARRVGGWGLLISHQATQDVRYLEYDETAVVVDARTDHIVGANHSLLESPRNGNRAPGHSIDRLQRLQKLVGSNGNGACSMETAQAALRDCHDLFRDCKAARPSMSTVRRMDNLMSLVMRPQQKEVWVAAGLQTETYQRLDLVELFDPHIMRRWVLRTVEAPLPLFEPKRFRGASLVIGNNPVANALHARLIGIGADQVDLIDSPEDALAFIDRTGGAPPVHHLFLLSGSDAEAPDLFSIYRVCQRWMERVQAGDLLSESSLTAATLLGGDFGFSGHVGIVEGGGLSGLLKAIRREFPGLKVKIIDAPREEAPDRLASEIIQELGSAAVEAEAGYCLGKRFTVRAVQRPALPRSPVPITLGGAWIVTGGAKGITAYAARALAEKYDLRIHVLGRSLTADLDYPAAYHCCDVSDAAALEKTIQSIRQDSGPIRGILHGAGVESAARFERKEMKYVRATIDAKAYGALHLMQLTRQDPLEVFLAFGSISGRFGGHGQTDYSLASDMLAKLIQRFRLERPDCASIAFHWPAWDAIGMAMRAESRTALELAGQRFMPPKEGLEYIFAELAAGAPEGEVLILDEPGALDLDGCMQSLPVTARMPLVEGLLSAESVRSLMEIRFDPVADPFLREHCYRGLPLLPAAAGLESLAEGAALWRGEGSLTLRDVEIRHGLSFPDRRSQLVRVEAARDMDGVACRLISAFRSRNGRLIDQDRVLIAGTVHYEVSAIPCAVPTQIPGSWHTVQYPKDGLLIHGPSFRCLKAIVFDKDKGFGQIVAQSSGKLGGMRQGVWQIPVAELDACLVVCGGFALKELDLPVLPRKFDLLRFFRQPVDGEHCLVHFSYRGRDDGQLRFDFVLFGADGTAILCGEGFGAAIVGQGMDL
jgi:acyl transferase domain-containing protein/NAD(P)-dependent dehydrogenase (short-subunit alcohol dehydrogenase family)/acyl carrier protein